AEDGIRDFHVTGVQTCALPISMLLCDQLLLGLLLNLTAGPLATNKKDTFMIQRSIKRLTSMLLCGAVVFACFPGVTSAQTTEQKIGRASCRERRYNSKSRMRSK